MANRSRSNTGAQPADAGDPGQRSDAPATPPAVETGAPDAEKLIAEVTEAAKVPEANTEPQSEADFGGSGEKKSLKTKGPYQIIDPTTGVLVTEESREVEMSAFLQGKIDDGLIEEA